MKPAKPPTFDVTTVFTDVCSPPIIIKQILFGISTDQNLLT